MTTIEEIVKGLDSKTERLQIDDEYVFIMDADTMKLLRAWKKPKGKDEYETLDVKAIVGRIAHKLKDKVDAEALLREHLVAQTHPAFLEDLDERLQKPDAVVKSKPRECYSLSIGGKRGRPLEFTLVHNQGNSG